MPILDVDPTYAAFIDIIKAPPKIYMKNTPKTVAASLSDVRLDKIVIAIHMKYGPHKSQFPVKTFLRSSPPTGNNTK